MSNITTDIMPRRSGTWSSIVNGAALFVGTASGLAAGSSLAFLLWRLI